MSRPVGVWPLAGASTKGSPIKRSDLSDNVSVLSNPAGLNEGLPDQEERRSAPKTTNATSQCLNEGLPDQEERLGRESVAVAFSWPQRRAPRSRGATAATTLTTQDHQCLNEGLPDQEERLDSASH